MERWSSSLDGKRDYKILNTSRKEVVENLQPGDVIDIVEFGWEPSHFVCIIVECHKELTFLLGDVLNVGTMMTPIGNLVKIKKRVGNNQMWELISGSGGMNVPFAFQVICTHGVNV